MNDNQLLSAKWASSMIKRVGWSILDTETTGLGAGARIVQLALIDESGHELINTLINPMRVIQPEATAIHGITNEMVKDAPIFEEVLISILKATGDGDVVIFNAEYDLRCIRSSAASTGIYLAFPTSERRQCRIFPNGGSIHCAMLQYARFVGEWSDYHQDYKFQKLPGGDHTALGDCRATLALIGSMANAYDERAESAQIQEIAPPQDETI